MPWPFDPVWTRTARESTELARRMMGEEMVGFEKLVKCPACDGTGEVHSHNPRCWCCRGRGECTAEEAREELETEARIAGIPRRTGDALSMHGGNR